VDSSRQIGCLGIFDISPLRRNIKKLLDIYSIELQQGRFYFLSDVTGLSPRSENKIYHRFPPQVQGKGYNTFIQVDKN
jgi:hypothetical protein